MNNTIAFLLGGLLLLVWVSILWAFKKLCLNKIKSGVLKYSLGMMLAYGILITQVQHRTAIPSAGLA